MTMFVTSRREALFYDGTNVSEALDFIGNGQADESGVITYSYTEVPQEPIAPGRWLIGLGSRISGEVDSYSVEDFGARFVEVEVTEVGPPPPVTPPE